MKSYSDKVVTPEKADNDKNVVLSRLHSMNEQFHHHQHTILMLLLGSLMMNAVTIGVLLFITSKYF